MALAVEALRAKTAQATMPIRKPDMVRVGFACRARLRGFDIWVSLFVIELADSEASVRFVDRERLLPLIRQKHSSAI